MFLLKRSYVTSNMVQIVENLRTSLVHFVQVWMAVFHCFLVVHIVFFSDDCAVPRETPTYIYILA